MQTNPYTPRPAHTPDRAEHSFQRRYGPDSHSAHGLNLSAERESRPEVTVYRDGTTDLAELQVGLGLWCTAKIEVQMTPSELRELAARLLDAAHDIETLPAAVLTKATA